MLPVVNNRNSASIRHNQGRRVAFAWFSTSALLLVLSLDDLTSLHERLAPLGERLGGGTGLTTATWLVPGLAAAAIVVLAVLVLAIQLQGRAQLCLLAGLILFLGASFGLESVGNAFLETQGFGRVFYLFSHVEELFEAWGEIILMTAALLTVGVRRDSRSVTLSYLG